MTLTVPFGISVSVSGLWQYELLWNFFM